MAYRFRERIVGRSRLTVCLKEELATAACRDDGVLLLGEPGSGKQLSAHTIHRLSYRRKGPFRAVDCSRFFPDDLNDLLFGSKDHPNSALLLLCDGGTLYIQRPEDLAFSTQEKLAGFLRSGTFLSGYKGPPRVSDVRIIAGTEKDIAKKVRCGLFVEELWNELSASLIHVPPLRERIEDIEEVIYHVAGWPAAGRFSQEVIEAFSRYPWPGNYDELIEEIKRLLRTGYGQIEIQHVRRDILECSESSCDKDPEIIQVLHEIDKLIAEFQMKDKLALDFTPYFWRGGPVVEEEEEEEGAPPSDWDYDCWESDPAW